MEEEIEFIKKLGVPFRPPDSEFFKEGNEDCEAIKPYGICDYDNEDFYHKPYPLFSCHIPGCQRTFETVMQYEAHYNSCHCFTCKECNKNLPNYHLLDLHISESHDSFFLEQAKRKPMYKCFVEECKQCFMDQQLRRDHCVKTHGFPSDFRFDSARKKSNRKVKNKSKKDSQEKMDTEEPDNVENKMEGIQENPKQTQGKKKQDFKGFSFGHVQGRRKPVFSNFSKDLMNSLPET